MTSVQMKPYRKRCVSLWSIALWDHIRQRHMSAHRRNAKRRKKFYLNKRASFESRQRMKKNINLHSFAEKEKVFWKWPVK